MHKHTAYLFGSFDRADFCWQESLRIELARALPGSDDEQPWIIIGLQSLRQLCASDASSVSTGLRKRVLRALELYDDRAISARGAVELVLVHTADGLPPRVIPFDCNGIERTRVLVEAARLRLCWHDGRLSVVQRGHGPDLRQQLFDLLHRELPTRLRSLAVPTLDVPLLVMMGRRMGLVHNAVLECIRQPSLDELVRQLCPHDLQIETLQPVCTLSTRWTTYAYCFSVAIECEQLRAAERALDALHTELFGYDDARQRRPLALLFGGVPRVM